MLGRLARSAWYRGRRLREAGGPAGASLPSLLPYWSRKTGEPRTRSGISNYVLWLAKQAGVRLSMHKLRKGFGCRAGRQLGKGNAPILHELMRHSSMQITMDYYANVDDAKQAAINLLT